MRPRNAELGLLEMQPGQILDQGVGTRHRQQLGDIERLLADEAGRVADTAHGGIFDQRLDGRGAGHAHMNGKCYALIAQALRPIGDGSSLKEELGGDIALNAMRQEIGLLELKRLDESRFAPGLDDVGIAFGVPGDPDLPDPMRLEQARLEELDGGIIDAQRLEAPPPRTSAWTTFPPWAKAPSRCSRSARSRTKRAGTWGTGSSPAVRIAETASI